MKLAALLSVWMCLSILSASGQPYDRIPAPGYVAPTPAPLNPAWTSSGFHPASAGIPPLTWIWSNNSIPLPPSIGLERFMSVQTTIARSQWGITAIPGQFSNIATPNDAVLNSDEGEDLVLAARYSGSNPNPASGSIRFSTLDHINKSYPFDEERMTIQSGGDVTIGGSLGIGFAPDQRLLSDPVNWQQQRKLDVRGGQVGITPPFKEAGVLTIMPAYHGSWWNIANIKDGELLAFGTGDMLRNPPLEMVPNPNEDPNNPDDDLMVDPTLLQASWGNAPLVLSKQGSIGINTLNPVAGAVDIHQRYIRLTSDISQTKMQIAVANSPGSFSGSTTAGDLVIRTVDGDETEDLIIASSNVGASLKFGTRMKGSIPAEDEPDNTAKMTIFDNGNVGIGINEAPHAKLAVKGLICAEEIKISLSTENDAACWPDYVFDPSYNLLPLNELEDWIATHKHLPDVPSEAAVNENGIQVGQMQAALLRKIEELTLYILQQEKRINELQQVFETLTTEQKSSDRK